MLRWSLAAMQSGLGVEGIVGLSGGDSSMRFLIPSDTCVLYWLHDMGPGLLLLPLPLRLFLC